MRLVLAALLVSSCRTPRAPRPAPGDAGTARSIDAATSPPIDASLDAPPATTAWGACDWNSPDPANPRCAPQNMPPMRCKDVNGPSPRFPKCIGENNIVVELRKPIVLTIKRHAGSGLVVDRGSNHEIDKTWRADVVDAQQRPLQGGQATFVRVDADEIEVSTRLRPDQVDKLATGVRFTPP